MSTTSSQVIAFCDWLETLPPGDAFTERPEYAFFAQFDEDELLAAEIELTRRLSSAIGRSELPITGAGSLALPAND